MKKPQLVHSRFVAFVVVVLTALGAYQATHAALRLHTPHSFHPFPRLPFLPSWALFALDVFYYFFVIWVCIEFFRKASERERFIVACWLFTFLLWPIQPFLSPGLAISIQYAKGLALSAAFFMSALLAFTLFVPLAAKRNTENSTPDEKAH